MARSRAAVEALTLVPRPKPRGPEQVRPLRLILGNSQPRLTADALLDRVGKLDQQRQVWLSHIREVYDLFLPQRAPLFDAVKGGKRITQVFDSTPMRALKKFASRLHLTLVPPYRRFARLVPGRHVREDERHGLARELEQQTEVLFQYLSQSNLATEVHEAILDCGVSTGAMLIQPGPPEQPIRFRAVPPMELILDEGPGGSVEDVFRCRKLKARLLKREWSDYRFSTQTAQLASEKPETEVEIVEATVYDVGRRHWEYYVVERGQRHVAVYRTMRESPWIVFRWSVVSGEVYGRGPAMDALPDAKTANRVVELILRNAALAVAGVYKAMDDGVLNPWTVRLVPGGVIPVASPESLQPLQTSHDFRVSELVLADLRENILRTMLAQDLGPPNEPQRTATELILRNQELMRDAGSSFGRLQQELVGKLIQKAVGILRDRGVLPPIVVDGREVDVEFEGPLARAQDEDDVMAFATFLEVAGALGPEPLHAALKADDAVAWVARKIGVSEELLRTAAERAALKAKIAEAAQAVTGQPVAGGSPQEAASTLLEQQAGIPPSLARGRLE